MVSASLEKIAETILPRSELPEAIEYRTDDGRCLDAIAFYVHAEFQADGFLHEIDYFLYTGDGGLRRVDDPVPDGGVENVKIYGRALAP